MTRCEESRDGPRSDRSTTPELYNTIVGSITNGLNGLHLHNGAAQELDALIVGAGFGSVYQLKHLRDAGYKVKLVEAGGDYGGVWYWNRYPGARVDSSVPAYEFSDPALWKTWSRQQRFPASAELRAYFAHVADVWDLRRDTEFGAFVESAVWGDGEARWTIKTKKGDIYKAKFFLLNTGFAAKRYIPDWKGIETFQGTFLHPSYWPHEGLDLKGKKVAVIGTGSTGAQLAADLTPLVGELAVFQRSINTSMPMRQVDYQDGEQEIPRDDYPDFYRGRTDRFGGFDFSFLGRSTFDDDAEKRRETYEKLWASGDFKFWLTTYQDMLHTTFGGTKARAKIHDARVRDLLAPMKQPYWLGCKRVSLENGYFEIFNESHVHLVDVNSTPIEAITPKGIKTSEKEWEFDYIICATGFDSLTGGLKQMDIRGPSGQSLAEHWEEATYTHLGLSVSGFPNMLFSYGPQAPTPFCNGPTCAQLQGDWILGLMNHMRDKGLKKVEAEEESEKKWRDLVLEIANATLLPAAHSWYMGDNIPGKPREPLVYLGGVPAYYKTLGETAENGYTGFKLE
ncbi:hypothetical protein PG994_007287 [Apiospora phragmitis]|uniref:FAD/NAD(P)-binding domain-containing protein n=1 Tax=Apiospora phragmitis TaxID=2905665 RepID=A0ABR1V0E0_9PEZI